MASTGLQRNRNTLLRWLPTARAISWVFFGYLAFVWVFVAVVDVYDVGGLRSALGRDVGVPAWFHLFGEGDPTEWMQAIALYGVVAATAAAVGVCSLDDDEDLSSLVPFLLLICAGTALLLLEDTSNVGQEIGSWVGEAVGKDSVLVHLARVPIFALAGAIPVYALGRYHRQVREVSGKALALFFAGYAVLGLMAFTGEFVNLIVPLYQWAGDFVFETLFSGRALELQVQSPGFFPGVGEDLTSVVFMDFVYEESLELIAATLLLLGSIALLRTVIDRRVPVDPASAK